MKKNLVLTLAVLALLWVISEIVLRAAGFHGINTEFNPVIFSKEFGWVLKPDYRATWEEFEWKISYSTNTEGFREPELTVAKPPGVFRILTLGDSFAEGHGIEESQMWQTQLAALLGKARVEILNFGVRGYDLIQEYHQLIEKGLAYDPDLVIQIINVSDILGVREADAAGHEWRYKPRYRIAGDHIEFETTLPQAIPSVKSQPLKRLFYRSAALTGLQRGIRYASHYIWDYLPPDWKPRPVTTPVMNLYQENYEKALDLAYADLKRRSETQGFRLILVWCSVHDETKDMPFAFREIVRRYFQDIVEIPLEGSRHERFRFDGHPNRKGHEIIARRLADYLKNQEMISSPGS